MATKTPSPRFQLKSENRFLVINTQPEDNVRAMKAAMAEQEGEQNDNAEESSNEAAAQFVAPRNRDSSNSGFVIGETFDVDLHILIEDPMNAREFYTVEDLEQMSASILEHGQYSPISAYEREGRLWVFDGVKRLKAARSAGIQKLRVDIRVQPKSDLETYLTSRRMNLERSTQSALDDAVRWKELLDKKIVESQQHLATLVSKSEGYISQVLSVNRIPRSVLTHMKERPKASDQVVAYKISCIFRPDTIELHGIEELSSLTRSIIDEIIDKDLGRVEIDRLIERRLGAPKVRAKSDHQKLKLFGKEALLKTFPSKGKVEFSVQGLSEEQMAGIEAQLRAMAETSATA